MKPLELVIFDEYHGSYSRRQMIDGVHHVTFHKPTKSKRFTDAELAAEVWRQESQVTTVEAMGGTPVRNIEALKTICRFATLPHYDEASL